MEINHKIALVGGCQLVYKVSLSIPEGGLDLVNRRFVAFKRGGRPSFFRSCNRAHFDSEVTLAPRRLLILIHLGLFTP